MMTATAACNASLAVAFTSHCPSASWQEAIAPLLVRRNMTLLNIGANKGFAVVGFLSRYLDGWRVGEREWREAQGVDCGVCQACRLATRPARARHLAKRASVLAVELIGNTSARLRQGFERFGVPGVVVHAAANHVAGVGYEPIIGTLRRNGADVLLGGEFVPEHFGLTRRQYGRRVNMTTVDALHAQHGLGVVGTSR